MTNVSILTFANIWQIPIELTAVIGMSRDLNYTKKNKDSECQNQNVFS